jgi:hypothetical protein
MEEAMNKIIYLTPALLKSSILTLLFFVTAAPSVIDNTRAFDLHGSSSNGPKAADGITPGTNRVNAERDTNHDGFVPTTKSLRQAHRNTNDGVAAPTNHGSMVLQPHGNEGIQQDGEQLSELNPFGITDQAEVLKEGKQVTKNRAIVGSGMSPISRGDMVWDPTVHPEHAPDNLHEGAMGHTPNRN